MHKVRFLAAILALAFAASAQAGTIFSEDFEGLNAGQSLAGQGGWVSDPVLPSTFKVENGSGLSSKVSSGPRTTSRRI